MTRLTIGCVHNSLGGENPPHFQKHVHFRAELSHGNRGRDVCLLCAPFLPTNSLLPELQLAGTCCSPGKSARTLLFPESFSSTSKWSRSKPDVPQRSRGLLALGPPPLNTDSSPVLDCGPDCNPNQPLLWWALGPGQRADARKNITRQQGSHRVLSHLLLQLSEALPLPGLAVLESWVRLEQPISERAS